MQKIMSERNKLSRVIDSNTTSNNRPDIKTVLQQYSSMNSVIQRNQTFNKNGTNLSVIIPADNTHWTVESPLAVIKDRVGAIRGHQFNGVNEITKLKPRATRANQTNITYAAKHHGGRAAGGISGTPCHVYNNGILTGYDFTIPHYHSCRKVAGLTPPEANGNAAINGVNDGMHLHTRNDINRIQILLGQTAANILMGNGETRIDTSPGGMP